SGHRLPYGPDRAIRGSLLAIHLRAVDFLRLVGRLSLRLTPQGAGFGPALPRVGISCGASDFCGGGFCTDRESFHPTACPVFHRPDPDPCRAPLLSPLDQDSLRSCSHGQSLNGEIRETAPEGLRREELLPEPTPNRAIE